MIYKQFERGLNREITESRLQHARRAIDRQQQRLALFVDQVDWQTPEERITAIDDERADFWQHLRDHRAATWRKYRRIVHDLPAADRNAIVNAWAASPVPKSSEYFATFVCKWILEHGIEVELD